MQLRRNNGFTLIELIAVLILIALVGIYGVSRISSSKSDYTAARDQLAAAFLLAQQLALARQTANNKIIITVSEKTIQVTEGGTPVNSHGLQFPLNDFSARVTFSQSDREISSFCFDKLGEVGEVQKKTDTTGSPVCEILDSPIDFSISGQLNLRLEPSGLVHVL